MSTRLLGWDDEPQESGAIVAVHHGDYRRQEIWVRSGANIGNWYPLGGEFGRPKTWTDPRNELQKMSDMAAGRPDPKPGPREVPLHPHWADVLARGPVTLLVPSDGQAYVQGWRAGRRALWQQMEELAEEDPR